MMKEKSKIIYVDDEDINLLMFEFNFSDHHEVITGHNGAEGLELLHKNPDADIIISDMNMPNMTGIEFIRRAKAKYPDKSFFILTGYEITEEIREALDSGLIHKYFKKPFNVKEIKAELNK